MSIDKDHMTALLECQQLREAKEELSVALEVEKAITQEARRMSDEARAECSDLHTRCEQAGAERARLRAALAASEAQRLDAVEWGNALEDKLYGALGECDRLRAALDWLVDDVIQLHWPCEAAGCDVCRNLGTASNLLAGRDTEGGNDDGE